MWNPLKALVVPIAALSLVACGSGSGASSATSSGGSTAPPATTALSVTPATTPSSEPVPSDVPVTGDAVEIIVNVDDPAQLGQVFPVGLGQTVILRLVSDTDQDYHVHGVDLEKQAAAGVEATFEFTADTPGDMEVESHITDTVLATIRVG
jgi:hypothetical protein